ncbi:MAG: sulfatase-like hydrolase/transferase [Verrucomicrobia bacterium]|nr:sulfatase-like hydrolase/transferase [Verrucomicrobiota bacterium]
MSSRPIVLALSIALGAPAAATVAAPAADRPNVLLIVADDLGYNDVGFQGCRDIPTPHLDRLAAQSVRCTSGYVSYSVCSPSRAGFLTGRYQQRFGHEFNPAWKTDDALQGLPLNERTIADALRAAGYTTGAVGKWHLGAHPQFHPNRRGFDEFFGFLGGGHRYLPGTAADVEVGAGRKAAPGNDAEHASPMLRNTTELPEAGELTTRLGEEAAAYISRHARDPRPWFLYFAFNAPHTPLQAREDMRKKFASIADERRRTYAAMVATLDESAGRALAAVDAAGQRERTLVFFFSDNGGPMTKRNANASINTPLRGQKGDVFEGGIRVPFLVSWPARLPAGRVYDRPVSSLDVLSTALAAAGAKPEPARSLDGVDLIPFLAGTRREPPHAQLFWRMDGGQAFAVRDGDWKWMRTYSNAPQLYNLAADLGETRDVAAQHPDVAARLAAAVADWNRGLVAPLWSNNPFGGLINQTGPAKNATP